MKEAAVYCGVSYWTFRDWLLQDLIPTMRLPPLQPREGDASKRQLRRVLIDKSDVDRFLDGLKR